MAHLIEDTSRSSVVSMASLWEISIKTSLGKLKFLPADDHDLPALLCAEGFDVQPISWPVIRRASQFPWHHPDPFDRYIAAEVLTRDAQVLSTDPTGDADARIIEVVVRLDAGSTQRVSRLSGLKVIARFGSR